VLLQEVDYRERNLRYSEVMLFTTLFEYLLMLTAELIPGDQKRQSAMKAQITSHVEKIIDKYEAELYQERYLPEYQRAMREISRREKEAEEEKRRREQAALDRVAEFDAGAPSP
jgi:hypothetical protein